VVVFESWPPVWRPEQGLQGAGEVYEAVAHEEEHGEEGGDLVDVA
jgi:hypothetical protein